VTGLPPTIIPSNVAEVADADRHEPNEPISSDALFRSPGSGEESLECRTARREVGRTRHP
jgi:hypothetical protein